MPRLSKYVLLCDNVSRDTPAKDIEREFGRYGRIRFVEKDSKYRMALIEFEKSADASYARRKMQGFRMDNRAWRVEPAAKEDFKFFGWKWFEDAPSRSPSPRGRSKSRSPSRSPSRGRSRSPSRGRSPSRTPPRVATPHNNDDRRSPSQERRRAEDNNRERGSKE